MSEPGIGHNVTPTTYPPPSGLEERLKQVYQAQFNEVEKWLASAGKAPAIIGSDEDYGKFATLAGKLITLRNGLDKAREAEKAPYLSAGRTVDTLFSFFIGRCKEAQAALEGRQGAYAKKKEAADRAAAQKIADEERARSDTALRQAARAQDNGDFDTGESAFQVAAEAEERAQDAQRAAEAPTAELTRVRGAGGAVASAKAVWDYEITNAQAVDLNALRAYFSADTIDKAVRAAVRGGIRELSGVRIFEDRKVKNKGI